MMLPLDLQLPEWWLVIDTNSYAGNFERELSGWCLGVTGESHGIPEAMTFIETYRNDEWALRLDETISCVGEHGERCTMWPTPKAPLTEQGTVPYNSVGVPFSKRPTHRHMTFVMARAQEFARKARAKEFKTGTAQFVDDKLEIRGVRVVRVRVSTETTSRLGAIKTKKYQRSKKNPRP